MEDLYALEGGSAATAWQRKHNRRKNREAALKARREAKAEAKADLAKRMKKWKAKVAAAKAAGLQPPSNQSKPRDLKKRMWKDITGQRFGRLTAIRIAPVSKNHHGGRNRSWWVKCDCGTAERLVAGTNLREGTVKSCGCLRRETVKENWQTGKLAKALAQRNKEKAQPIGWHLLRLRRSFHGGSKEAKLISRVRNLLIAYELRLGIRKPRKSWKTDRYKLPTIH